MAEDKNILNTTSFYNEIAADYNSQMTVQDGRTRKIVREAFLKLIDKGNVLDFGAGTGLDLAWLTGNKDYTIFALEPSAGMREIAKEAVKQIKGNPKVRFIERDTDVKLWTKERLPFPQKIDGILANFAVLNHIQDLDILFEKLSLVSNSGCIVVALVLDARFAALRKQYSTSFAIKNIFKNKITVLNKHNQALRETYLYTVRAISRAAGSYFKLQSCMDIATTPFSLIILRKP